ncbi:MAG: hypothetical protein HXY38_05160 [Chloroflexi bacterium]|nr:hypothetical protein [Chloroflexota bacterium]
MDEKRESFFGIFFDKSAVLKLSRWAGMLAWVALGAYLFTFLTSFTQFMMQFITGMFFQKGMSIVDVLSFFNPYLTLPIPGIVYFFGLKFVEHSLLILLEMEESARRSARSK